MNDQNLDSLRTALRLRDNDPDLKDGEEVIYETGVNFMWPSFSDDGERDDMAFVINYDVDGTVLKKGADKPKVLEDLKIGRYCDTYNKWVVTVSELVKKDVEMRTSENDGELTINKEAIDELIKKEQWDTLQDAADSLHDGMLLRDWKATVLQRLPNSQDKQQQKQLIDAGKRAWFKVMDAGTPLWLMEKRLSDCGKTWPEMKDMDTDQVGRFFAAIRKQAGKDRKNMDDLPQNWIAEIAETENLATTKKDRETLVKRLSKNSKIVFANETRNRAWQYFDKTKKPIGR
jgi:hypothetical protein